MCVRVCACVGGGGGGRQNEGHLVGTDIIANLNHKRILPEFGWVPGIFVDRTK